MKILILGSNGCIGSAIANALVRIDPSVQLVGTYSSHPYHSDRMRLLPFSVDESSSTVELLDHIQPDVVINALSWRVPLKFLEGLAHTCAERKLFQLFVSSSRVFDGDLQRSHHESDPLTGVSEYGRAKADAERILVSVGGSFAIVRFSAPHGWAPFMKTRTVKFLERLRDGETVSVDRHVIQNRLSLNQLGRQISVIALRRESGIFHLGAIDQSEEIDFLRKVASAFGYDSKRVIPNESAAIQNVVTVPEQIFYLLDDAKTVTETETIQDLLRIPELEPYLAQ